ncbi:MAG: peptidase C14 caspase catalytic subunit p20 [Saprospiraceae bacterium]|nr:peptidase C14 caspase catalytic subunit p20 [Saprospiraceae bacterium]
MNRLALLLILTFTISISFSQKCIRGNCTQGFGTLVYPNKSRYTGEFNGGWMTGRGIYFYANGNKYIGYWSKNQKHGEGKLIYANGNIYSGKFKNDRITGFGSMTYKTGDKYTGEWLNENPNGKGTFYYSTGERYEGEFIAGKYNGKGKLFYTNGSYYEGEWKDDQRNGYGEFVDISGKSIEGQWEKDQPLKVIETSLEDLAGEPANTDTPSTNTIPQEELKEEKIEIVAEEKIKPSAENKPSPVIQSKPIDNVTTAEEKLPNCNTTYCKSGKGIIDYADGSKYVGEFVNGEPKGTGICEYANGDRYEGMWANHAPHGEGVMYFKSGLVYGAIWENGVAKTQINSKQDYKYNPNIKEDKDAEVKIWAVVVGVSRYVHMPALKYSDDDAYKIYAFLKSPEGGALPDEQISLLIDEDATRNNILKSLNELSLKADDNDVVMVYFSGHGLEGTFIPIDYDGYQNALKHDDIRDMLSKSNAKHKVCYADACHSGSLLAAKSPFASDLNFFYEELEKTKGGTAFMMSSKSKEYSLEDGGLRQGIFSHYLIRGLKGEADINKNKTITIRELFDFVSKSVKDYSGSAQSPVIAGDYDELMPVGFVRGR